jgi:hypothetical protein
MTLVLHHGADDTGQERITEEHYSVNGLRCGKVVDAGYLDGAQSLQDGSGSSLAQDRETVSLEAGGPEKLSVEEAEQRLKALAFRTGDESTAWLRELRDESRGEVRDAR